MLSKKCSIKCITIILSIKKIKIKIQGKNYEEGGLF